MTAASRIAAWVCCIALLGGVFWMYQRSEFNAVFADLGLCVAPAPR